MSERFGWLDVQVIAEELADAHPGRDPLAVSFVDLRDLVEALEGFTIEPGARSEPTERILEEIQRLWNEEDLDLQGDDG
ncbi:MAG: Fe-S cluster assembly protein IscX [Planctomycetota bacterium]